MTSLFTIKNILIAVAIGAAVWFFMSWQNRGNEMERYKANYENKLKEANSQYTEFTFKKNREFEELLSQNTNELKGLQQRLDDADIKLRNIKQLVNSTLNVRDTIINKINMDGFAEKIKINQPFSQPFTDDVSKCFVFKGSIDYDGTEVKLNIKDRQFTDTINYVYHWERNRWKVLGLFNTRIFGKKILKDTVLSNCGNIKTLVINNN